jgi:N-acetylmuramoyl-L-alanine amidase
MRKKYKYFILVIITIIFIFLDNLYICTKVFATPTQIDGNKVVLIDPGHGGIDGGAVSKNGTIEKYLNLDISLKVRERLIKLGYQVLMTRDEDRGLYTENGDINKMKVEDLNNRCKMKRDSNCDLFISIHQNFFEQSSCHGAQIWYSKNDESGKLAQIIQENLNKDLGYNKRKVKEANNAYKILRCFTNIPSIIIECGFITNSEEENKLKSEAYQVKIADSIVKSIQEYFDASNSLVLDKLR